MPQSQTVRPGRAENPLHWRAAFQSREFALLQYARAARTIATEMIFVAVGWQVYQLTGRPSALGYAGLAEFLPGLLLFLLAGHLADRVDRRTILIGCFGAYAISAAVLAVTCRLERISVTAIYVLVAILGATRTFAGPAAQALLPQVVPPEHFPNAVAWGSTAFTLSTIIGPVAGGALYDLAKGPTTVYLTAAVVYLCALLMMTKIRTRSLVNRKISGETTLEGLRYVWSQKVILGCISLDLSAVLLGGVVALLPIFAKDILHTGPWGLGLLRSASPMGAVLMALWIARHPLNQRAGAKMLSRVALFGLCTIIFGLSTNLLLSVAALLLLGAADMVSVIVRGTLVQLATPPEMRGRVSAVNLLFTGASNQVGQFESGLTAQWFGTAPAVVFGGASTLLIVVIWSWCFPEIRQIRSLSGIEGLGGR